MCNFCEKPGTVVYTGYKKEHVVFLKGSETGYSDNEDLYLVFREHHFEHEKKTIENFNISDFASDGEFYTDHGDYCPDYCPECGRRLTHS